MPALFNGDRFPDLSIRAVGGGTLSLPGDLAGAYGVVLFYRGVWCPYCAAQLSAFARAAGPLAELGIKVAALSVDAEAASAEFAAKHGVTFPVGFGADAKALAAATGAYTSADPLFLQSTGFVLDPESRVITAVYSSGAIGRLVPDDVLGFIRYVKSKK